jgi:hypothetical protein
MTAPKNVPPGTPGKHIGERINRLPGPLMYKLTIYVAEHYAASGLTDIAFAETHQDTLGFPLTASNIASARENLSLPSNVAVIRAAKATPVSESRLSQLESRVAVLEQRLAVYLDGCQCPATGKGTK